MADVNKKLRRATIFFWVLLVYIIAVLVWWFVLLERQNAAMFELKRKEITNSTFDKASPQFNNTMDDIYDHRLPLTSSPIRLSKPGEYIFTIQQIMREDPLKHIMDVGLRIEKKP